MPFSSSALFLPSVAQPLDMPKLRYTVTTDKGKSFISISAIADQTTLSGLSSP
jgi:hypothetical protein